MNVDLTPRALFTGLVAASNLNTMQPSAGGLQYKADGPVAQIVVHSAVGATVEVSVQSSIDGVNFVAQAAITATSSSSNPQAMIQQRLTGVLGVYWRASILSATGDTAATVDCSIIG